MRKTSKKILVIILVFTFSLSPLSFSNIFSFSRADTVEEISGYTEWNQSRTVDKNIIIKPEATLVIGKGVKIDFTQLATSIDVQGSLFINGSIEEPAILKCNVENGGFYITTEENSKVSIRNAEIIKGGFEAYLVKKSINTALAENYKAAVQIDGGDVNIQNTTFKNNLYAVIVSNPDAKTHVNYSRFIDNNFDVSAGAGADFKYNWWGFSDGPQQTCYIYGNNQQYCYYQKIYGDFDFSDWMTEENFELGASNILFLPGLEASRLYGNSDSTCPYSEKAMNLAWEPNCNEDVRRLYLNSDGKSLNPIHTKEGDVVDETPIGANIYLSFIEKMNKLKNEDKLINDWKAIAYDWRLSPDDILSDNLIINNLRNLAENSKTKKVTIVAHSNGGLIAKALMQKLGDEEAKKIIDKIVFVAVPQVGTPSAVAGMLHGYKQNFFPVLDTETARSFGENMPGAYNLLPSEQYFSSVDTPTVTFDTDSSSDWKARYENPIHSKNGLHEFLSDTYRRVSATDSNTDIPAKLNESLLENAENLHDSLDDWTAPEGVKVIQIAGWGVPATLSSTKYDTEKGQICDGSVCSKNIDILDPDFKFTIDGDGTVVTPSALWMKDAERYWVDIGKWNKDHPFSTVFGFNSHDHSDILEIPEILTFIDNTIINNNIDIPQYFSKDVPQIGGHPNRLQYSLHSPLTLNLYDDQGRHTGINPVTGQVEEQIPGTYYRQIGDVKYIFSDEDSVGKIVMNGYDTGTFTFSVDEFQGDTLLGNITFKDMPTTPETEATIDIASNLASASSLNIDKNGDGTPDFSLQPKIGEIVTLDSISPTTEISIDSEKGTNNWHTSDAKITLTATDNENGSGVDKTEYSLDNGQTWSNYTEPINISQEGATTLQYFSTDKQGNKEEIKTETIKIDKTAPEAKIQFNSTTQKLDIIGTDNLTQNVSLLLADQPIVNKSNPRAKKIKAWFSDWQKRNRDRRFSNTVATLVDEAGHTTNIVFMKTKDKNNRIFVTIKSIAYNGIETAISKTSMQYKWQMDRKKQYSQLASHIQSESAIVESHYLPKKNQTWLMEKPRELADDNGDDDSEKRPTRTKLSGMIIPMLITENGKVKVDY